MNEFDIARTLASLPKGAPTPNDSMPAERSEAMVDATSVEEYDEKVVNLGNVTFQVDSESAKNEKVLLDRDTLLHTTSKDFEDYMSQIAKNRSLSPAEQRQLKAQRRESAQASRRRKKAYVEEMEQKVNESNVKIQQLMSNNALLTAQVNDLSSEVKILSDELDKERKIRKENSPSTHSPGDFLKQDETK